jgi:hypothetical protein
MRERRGEKEKKKTPLQPNRTFSVNTCYTARKRKQVFGNQKRSHVPPKLRKGYYALTCAEAFFNNIKLPNNPNNKTKRKEPRYP